VPRRLEGAPPAAWQSQIHGGCLNMLALPAKLNISEAGAALAALAPQVVQGSGPLVIDAGALDDFDSSAIATLIELRRQAKARAFSVRGAPKAMVELATLYGVGDLLAFDQAPASRA
jgi:phospholipid transport system transporter-binding protein